MGSDAVVLLRGFALHLKRREIDCENKSIDAGKGKSFKHDKCVLKTTVDGG
jgi:hypothetical protein